MTARRRRERPSDWLLALNASRSAKKMRHAFPSSTEFTQVDTGAGHSHDCQTRSIAPEPSDNHVTSGPAILRNYSTEMQEQDSSHLIVYEEDNSSVPALENRSMEEVPITGHDVPQANYSGDAHPSSFLIDQFEDRGEHITQYLNEAPLCSGNVDSTSNNEDASQRVCANARSEKRPDMTALSARREKWEFRLTLTALIAVVGSVRFTVHQYDYTRDVLKDISANPDDMWPPYSKTQIHFRDIIKHCLPHSHVVCLPKLGAKRAYTNAQDPALENEHNGADSNQVLVETERVRIFLPSAWARLDVGTSVTFDDMYPDATDAELNSVNLYPIVCNRSSVTSVCDSIFISNGGECVPCGPGSLIEVKVLRETPQIRTQFRFQSGDGSYTFSAVVTATWCVGANDNATQSFERALKQRMLSECERNIAQRFSMADSRSEDSNPASHTASVLPGDICTILSPHSASTSTDTSEYRAVLVHRFWRFEEGIPSIFIRWVRVSANNSFSITYEGSNAHIVKEVNLVRFSNQTTQNPTQHASRGQLSNGTPYVVYRILLYCDDFQRSSQHYPRGSAGGCYFLPLSLPPEKRRTTSAVRVISLTPPGVSTNQVLEYIIDDLVRATTFGIDGHTPDGSPVKIFMDVVGFVGDYPAAAATIDVLGHVSRAPCTLCTFRRQHASVADGSRYGYTTDVHSGNSSFLRHSERHFSLRKAGISANDANFLGKVETERTNSTNNPLLQLSKEIMRKKEHIPLSNTGNKVVPGLFDPFRSNIVAPDHLLTGLARDVLNTVFQCMSSIEMRAHADAYICSALKANGLLTQRTVYNHRSKSIHSMTLSELYCVLLVASSSLRNVITTSSPDHPVKISFLLLQALQRLIALTYWDPRPEVDGEIARYYLNNGRRAKLSALKALSKEYVVAVDSFCSKHKLEGGHLDKPNLHRLIELYEHTIPAFGHVREIM